jgi:putative ABC transport system permease protein
VSYWAPRVKAAGLASVGSKSTGASILGVDPERENRATRFDRKITQGRTFSPDGDREAVLGTGLARVLEARVGDTLILLSQAADGSIANDAYEIVGLSESGSGLQDQTTLYLRLSDAEELFALEHQVHEIAVILDELDDVLEVAARLKVSLADAGVAVAPWQEFAKAFYRAMQVDREGTWIMLGIIILLVAVGVLNTVLMTVLERRREYGVLRAVGTAPGQLFRMVTIEVAAMALGAIVVGALLAWASNAYLTTHGISPGFEFTYGGVKFDSMYSTVNSRTFWIPGVCVLLSALIVAMFPAARAAHTPPARAMRQY